LQNAPTQHSLTAIDYQMPTPFPSQREAASRKSDFFDEGTYIDICKGVWKTSVHKIVQKTIDYQMPTSFPSRMEGASRKSDFFDEGTYSVLCN